MESNRKEIVVPGSVLGASKDSKAGSGTYVRGEDIVACMTGLVDERGQYINIIPLGGRFSPRNDKNDLVIGIVLEASPTFWTVDINSPYNAILHANDTPWRVDYGDAISYLARGDAVIARTNGVGPLKRVSLTLNDKGLRKLMNGHIITMEPSRVPRMIGKKGSMLYLLKRYSECRIFVGQNGRIWVQGSLDAMDGLEKVVRHIEGRSHLPGLTEEVQSMLEETFGPPREDGTDRLENEEGGGEE